MDAITQNHPVPGIAALILYLISTALLWQAVFTEKEYFGISRRRVITVGLITTLGALLHLAMLLGTAFKSEAMNFSFFNSLSVSAWITVILLLLVSIGRPVLTLGLFLFPTSAAIIACAITFAGTGSLTVEPQLQWHVLISVIAYALLTMAALQSVLVSLQDRRLHDHRPGGLLRALPSLMLMEQVLVQLLIVSFLTLSLALITGFIFLDDLFAQRLVHKTALSVLALILLAVLLAGHYRFGWRGQKAAKMTLCAYGALVLGYFGSKFVKELVLSS